MNAESSNLPSAPHRALVFFLTTSEQERFDLVMKGEHQRMTGLQNGALNVVRSLKNAQLMKPVEGEDDVWVIEPFIGHKIVRIEERGIYRLPQSKFDLIRHVQAAYMPDTKVNYLRESKAQLQSFLNDWSNEHNLDAGDIQVGPWLMCGKLNTVPTGGSGIVYFYEGDPIYYVTVPGLEAFKLEASDKERTRSTTKRKSSAKNDPSRAIIEPLEERLRTLNDEEQRLNKVRAGLEEKLGANKSQLDANAAEQSKIKQSLEILKA